MKVTTPSKLLIGRIRQVLSDNEMDIPVDELACEFGDFCNDANKLLLGFGHPDASLDSRPSLKPTISQLG